MSSAILITGASKRLGAFLATYLAQQGYDIILHYHHSKQEALTLAQHLQQQYHIQVDLLCHNLALSCDTIYNTTDNTNHTHHTKIYQTLIKHAFTLNPKLSTLIHNASIFHYDLPNNCHLNQLNQHFQVNVFSPILLSQQFLAQKTDAMIINILDNQVVQPNFDYFSYTLSKTSLYHSTQLFAKFYRQQQPLAKIYGIAPSMILESGEHTVGKVEQLTKINPLTTNITPNNVFHTVQFLLTGIAQSGEVILVDGGQHLWQLTRDVAYL